MILVDANLLLCAEDSLSQHHQAAREWWVFALDQVFRRALPASLSETAVAPTEWSPYLHVRLKLAVPPRSQRRALGTRPPHR